MQQINDLSEESLSGCIMEEQRHVLVGSALFGICRLYRENLGRLLPFDFGVVCLSVLVNNDPASYEISFFIRLMCATGLSAAEIHRELCLVYGPTVMKEGK
ncbi:hypothetical protein J6590_092271, partial [Homalodisca vitripennis]